MAEAVCQVVVAHADGLHEGVADGGADEAEAVLFEGLAHGAGNGRFGWNITKRAPLVL